MPAESKSREAGISRSREQLLIQRAQAGDEAAFAELVRATSERLYAVLLRFTGSPVDAEEAMQEAFLRAWRSIGRFESRARFFTWLYRIAINEAKRLAERRRPRAGEVSLDESPLAEAPDWSRSPELVAEQAGAIRALERAITELSPDYRAPVVLRDIEGLSTREAAAVLELGEAAFKSRLHRGRMAVRRALDEYFAEERAVANHSQVEEVEAP